MYPTLATLPMLIGEYIHSLDGKNRLSLPSKFRKEVGKKVIITRGLDNCLFIFPIKEWQNISEKIGALGMSQYDRRHFGRFMFSGASEADVDGNGRVLIPDFLREFALLQEKVVVAGVHDRIELWNESRWKSYKRKIEKQGEQLAEKLGELGVL